MSRTKHTPSKAYSNFSILMRVISSATLKGSTKHIKNTILERELSIIIHG